MTSSKSATDSCYFFFQAEDGIRDDLVTGVQTCALPISNPEEKIRLSKSSLRVRAIGAIDELDSFIGLGKSFTKEKNFLKILSDIQKDLLTIGSILAGSDLKFPKSKTTKLERFIDKWDLSLPKLSNFILPCGTNLGAQLH